MSRRKNKLVPFETIVLATQGDPQALEQVIRHYRPYILSLCRREYIAENGNVSIVCDNELKLRLEAKLMAKILLFDIRERGPVSYTHLDVYKRQVPIYHSAIYR